jgi:hypothetical protein
MIAQAHGLEPHARSSVGSDGVVIGVERDPLFAAMAQAQLSERGYEMCRSLLRTHLRHMARVPGLGRGSTLASADLNPELAAVRGSIAPGPRSRSRATSPRRSRVWRMLQWACRRAIFARHLNFPVRLVPQLIAVADDAIAPHELAPICAKR